MFIAKITLPAWVSGTREDIVYSVRNDVRDNITVNWFELDFVKKFPTRQKAKIAARQTLFKSNFVWREHAKVEIVELTETVKEELIFLYLRNY